MARFPSTRSAMNTVPPTSDASFPEAPPDAPLPWPPPGLTRVQGDAWRISRKFTVGGLLLVVPLLLAMSARDPFELGGALGDAWWLAVFTTLIGVLLLAFACVDAGRLLGRGIDAVRRGHGWTTVAMVAADRTRDMGFLVQGIRHFSGFTEAGRRALAWMRTGAAAVLLLGSLWVSMGFALGLALGARGALQDSLAVTLFTLVPFGLSVVVGTFLILWDRTALRAARRRWYEQPRNRDLEQEAVEAWVRDVRNQTDSVIDVPKATGGTGPITAARWALYIGGAGVTLFALGLAGVMALASITATVGTGAISTQALTRMANAEPLRQYRAEPDPEVGPQEAGELLQVLLTVGRDPAQDPVLRAPSRRHADPWFPPDAGEGDGPVPHSPEWIRSLLERGAGGLDAGEVEYLRRVTGHAAEADFSRLARASEVDVLHGRWRSPLPAGTRAPMLPLPRSGDLWTHGTLHHLLVAALLAAEGRTPEAEARIREVISLGLLLLDDGPLLLDNLVGGAIAVAGGDALEALYRGSGRDLEARSLSQARRATRTSVLRTTSRAAPTTRQALRELRHTATDTLAPRGTRWESFLAVNTVTPCLNLDRIVFGPGPEYRSWVEEARDVLVRWPSEVEIFEIGRYGFFGQAGPVDPLPLPLRPLAWLTGGTDEPGSCGAALTHVWSGR
jgi:hypothetical protein